MRGVKENSKGELRGGAMEREGREGSERLKGDNENENKGGRSKGKEVKGSEIRGKLVSHNVQYKGH
jgi:hypothetical protein